MDLKAALVCTNSPFWIVIRILILNGCRSLFIFFLCILVSKKFIWICSYQEALIIAMQLKHDAPWGGSPAAADEVDGIAISASGKMAAPDSPVSVVDSSVIGPGLGSGAVGELVETAWQGSLKAPGLLLASSGVRNPVKDPPQLEESDILESSLLFGTTCSRQYYFCAPLSMQ